MSSVYVYTAVVCARPPWVTIDVAVVRSAVIMQDGSVCSVHIVLRRCVGTAVGRESRHVAPGQGVGGMSAKGKPRGDMGRDACVWACCVLERSRERRHYYPYHTHPYTFLCLTWQNGWAHFVRLLKGVGALR